MSRVAARDSILVVGGGIQGLLTAYELTRAGEAVIVLDSPGERQASWAGGGILSPLHPWRYPDAISRLSVWGQRVYSALCAELHANTAISAEYRVSGMAILAADVGAARDWAARYEVLLRTLRPGEVDEEVLGLRPQTQDAVVLPNTAQVRSPRLLQALKAALARAQVEIKTGVRVEGAQAQNGRLSALRTSIGDLPASRCVVTAGAWTGNLLSDTGIDLPIYPVCGQMLLLNGRALGLERIVLEGQYYLIPRAGGLVLVGSTMEQRGFDQSVTAAARDELAAAAARMLPATASCEVLDQWAGLRPGSPDGVPFIGAHPYIDGLFINAGHFRNGIVLAPASARLVTDLILGRPPILDPRPYSPALPRPL